MRRDPAAVDRNSKKDKPFNPRKNTGCRCFSFFTIFTFTACVMRFNVWRYPYPAAAPLGLLPLFMGCGVALSPVLLLAACAARLPPPLRPCGLIDGWPLIGGAVSAAAGSDPSMPPVRGLLWRASLPKSLPESPGKSQKSLA